MAGMITLDASDGHRFLAYRAAPKDSRPVAGLVVIQEIFGVNSHIRAVCDGLASKGFVVMAPSLFDRLAQGIELDYTPEGTAQGRALRTELGWDAPLRDIQAACDALRAETDRIGTMGFCWGGSLSFLAACRLNVAASVCYYGAQISDFCGERAQAPLLMHFGRHDPLIPEATVAEIKAAQPQAEIHVYEAGHGFNCDQRADYFPEAAKAAMERSLGFLGQKMI